MDAANTAQMATTIEMRLLLQVRAPAPQLHSSLFVRAALAHCSMRSQEHGSRDYAPESSDMGIEAPPIGQRLRGLGEVR